MGFQVYRSPDVETDDNNFSLLNIPPYHPARDMWDTFHTTQPDVVLRTHTSPGQIRVMKEYAPDPIRVILPGMCYRYEQVTVRSEFQFNQVEGLAVATTYVIDLKAVAAARRLRRRPPVRRSSSLRRPSARWTCECILCDGAGCQICKHTGWLGSLRAGMVYPVVLKNGGYDPAKFSGQPSARDREKTAPQARRSGYPAVLGKI
jgi:phenylalanyl-tRNA synthetase alpha chain